jgi:sulfite oxidase
MNGEALPRDHGFPLRVVVPGFVGARSVKWLDRIVLMKDEVDCMHQTGIAYKHLAPNQKTLVGVPKAHIAAVPPIDHVPVTSAILLPEPGASLSIGADMLIQGYAYSGSGSAIFRVDVSLNGGDTWQTAEIERADERQKVRGGKAWAWVQWKLKAKVPDQKELEIVCKAVDDQYNQQPHEPAPIWNIRGILNTSWGRVKVTTRTGGLEITEEAMSGDNTVENVGIKMDAKFGCDVCRQRFPTEEAKKLHWKFIHDPNRHLED